MVSIHPTAVVHPGAQLGVDVVIGPYTIIEDDVQLGDGCEIAEHAKIHSLTRLGPGNRVDKGASLGGDAQHLRADKGDCYLEIGAHNIIREYVTIHRASHAGAATRVGDHNLLMAFVHLGHDVVLGNHVSLANLATVGGHCVIQDRANIGGMVAVHQWTTVGEMAMVGGMTGVNQDVPPYAMVEGVPGKVVGMNTVGLRRNDISAEVRADLKKAIRVLFLSKRNRSMALEELERDLAPSPQVNHLLAFVRAIQQGHNGRQLEH